MDFPPFWSDDGNCQWNLPDRSLSTVGVPIPDGGFECKWGQEPVAAEEVGQWSVSINDESVLFHRASFNILTENEGFVSDIRFVNIGYGATQKG